MARVAESLCAASALVLIVCLGQTLAGDANGDSVETWRYLRNLLDSSNAVLTAEKNSKCYVPSVAKCFSSPVKPFQDPMSCNRCSCSKGQLVCTRAHCPTGCVYSGRFYKQYEFFNPPDHCNSCLCRVKRGKPTVQCTKMTCHRDHCIYKSGGQLVKYGLGEKWLADDCTHTCVCQKGGKISCPMIAH